MEGAAPLPDLAGLLDYTLLRPDLTEAQVVDACASARGMGAASVTVRPCDIDAAVRALGGSSVAPGSVVSFPHGDATTATKLYELRELLRRGARELDAVLNVSRMLSRQFQYVESEIQQMADSCRKEGARLKVIFENCYLSDELKIVACRICSRAEVHFVSTSTHFSPGGYTPDDLRLLRKYLPEDIALKAGSGVRTAEMAREVMALGCTRIATTHPAQLLEAWRAPAAG
ncbi:MAG TPA: deoxyribose-phosphate aldolase [Solibacterales bacterium]|nr:deoxyribose-phosphate aldolase [Bryobacterales bacterium]